MDTITRYQEMGITPGKITPSWLERVRDRACHGSLVTV